MTQDKSRAHRDEDQKIIQETANFVQSSLANAETGHDWWHILRVWNLTKTILQHEIDADPLICELAALLHDIADPKFHQGDDEKGPAIAGNFLEKQQVTPQDIEHVQQIIRHMSYSSSLDGNTFYSKEFALVQDADRLDAMGAVGIARTFNYGGHKNAEIFNPGIPHRKPEELNKASYRAENSTTINHFHEKLLHLKDLMHTAYAKKLAEHRHKYMVEFLVQFDSEWTGQK